MGNACWKSTTFCCLQLFTFCCGYCIERCQNKKEYEKGSTAPSSHTITNQKLSTQLPIRNQKKRQAQVVYHTSSAVITRQERQSNHLQVEEEENNQNQILVTLDSFENMMTEAEKDEQQGQYKKAKKIFTALEGWISLHQQQLINKEEVRCHISSSMVNILAENNEPQYSQYFSYLEQYYMKDMPKYYEEYISLMNNLSIILLKNKQYKQSQKYCEKALKISQKYYTIFQERKYYIINNLMCILIERSQKKQASQLYQQTISMLKEAEGENFDQIRQMLNENIQSLKQRKSIKMGKKTSIIYVEGQGLVPFQHE